MDEKGDPVNQIEDEELRDLLLQAAEAVPPGPSASDLLARLEGKRHIRRRTPRRIVSAVVAVSVAAAALAFFLREQDERDTRDPIVVASDPAPAPASEPPSSVAAPTPSAPPAQATVDTGDCPPEVQAAFAGVSFTFGALTPLPAPEPSGGMEFHPSRGKLTLRSERSDDTSFSGGLADQTLLDPETRQPVGTGELQLDAVMLVFDVPAGGTLGLRIGPPVGGLAPGRYGIRVRFDIVTTTEPTQPTFCQVVVEGSDVMLR